MSFTQTLIINVLKFMGIMISVGIIYRMFFEPKIVIIQPTPKKVVVTRQQW